MISTLNTDGPGLMLDENAMNNKLILVIDDETQIRRFLKIGLESRQFGVIEAMTGEEGLTLAVMKKPDIILLDLNLPDMSGLLVLKKLREWYTSPIIVITVRESELDKIELLDNGADDYLTKPFNMGELLARIRAILRRADKKPEDNIFSCSGITIDFSMRSVKINGETVKFTPLEYELLKLFAQNPGKVLTQKNIMREIWGPGMESETNYLRVYIAMLRKKIETDPSRPKIIVTEPAVGYRFMADQ
jgi:two-component system, OmpR family, KDP operon response regulator KdpE